AAQPDLRMSECLGKLEHCRAARGIVIGSVPDVAVSAAFVIEMSAHNHVFVLEHRISSLEHSNNIRGIEKMGLYLGIELDPFLAYVGCEIAEDRRMLACRVAH